MNKRLISMVFAAAIAAVSFSAVAQKTPLPDRITEEGAKHISTMAAIQSQSEAMGKMADAMKAMAERAVAPTAPAPVYVQPAAAPMRDCTGWAFVGCAISYTWSGVKEVIHELQPFAPAAAQIIMGKQNGETQRYVATEARLTNADNQKTVQQGFLSIENVALKPAPVTPPAPVQPPTTQIVIRDNTGPVNVAGSQDNRTNPAPVVCFVGTPTPQGTCSRG